MTIDELIQNFYLQQKQVDLEIENYDKEFADKRERGNRLVQVVATK